MIGYGLNILIQRFSELISPPFLLSLPVFPAHRSSSPAHGSADSSSPAHPSGSSGPPQYVDKGPGHPVHKIKEEKNVSLTVSHQVPDTAGSL